MKSKLFITLLSLSFFLSTQAQFTKLHDFLGVPDGYLPLGSLFFDGSFLYGMTQKGGNSANCPVGCGIIFKIKPDGTGFAKLWDFDDTLSGKDPGGFLIIVGDFLFGMTTYGGINDLGTIFKIKTDGTGFSKLLDFDGATNGKLPFGSFYFDGTYLYGMTQSGATNNRGAIFKIKPDGTDYTMLMDFSVAINGQGPYGDLISDGTYLYGMTRNGGTYNRGVIFKVKPNGTDYTKLYEFPSLLTGAYPNASLFFDGTFLYGMTPEGGILGFGTIFKIKPDGTDYSILFDFNRPTDGAYPKGSLFSDSSFLYGMTQYGGANNFGTIFKINTDGTMFTKLFDFKDTTGNGPYGNLISDGSVLYGMATFGGTYDKGVIFKINKNMLAVDIAQNSTALNCFNFYPNPNNGNFTFETSMKYGVGGKIEIYNSMSRKVYQTIICEESSTIKLNLRGNLFHAN